MIVTLKSKQISIVDLKKKTTKELYNIAEKEGCLDENAQLNHMNLLSDIINHYLSKSTFLVCEGTAEVLPDGYAFLRFPDENYIPGKFDIYIAAKTVKKDNIKTGDTVLCSIGNQNKGEKFFPMKEILMVNGKKPEKIRNNFDNLTPIYPQKQIKLETKNNPDITGRIIDIVAPFGYGQRGLIVAPPKTGKTTIMQKIVSSIEENYPNAKVIVLLIDERPEEVTDMQRNVKSEVVFSTFDESPNRHVRVAEMVIEKAKRMVEDGEDVIILFDSITRLARAYNTITPSSGKVLTGGVDANALQKPKRFFGAARNTEEAGSLTIIATALVETGSKMDEVIFEEFKSTGNMEIVLDRKISEKRIYPCIAINKSGTRKEEDLLSPEDLKKCSVLRKIISDKSPTDALSFLKEKLERVKSNSSFFDSMNNS